MPRVRDLLDVELSESSLLTTCPLCNGSGILSTPTGDYGAFWRTYNQNDYNRCMQAYNEVTNNHTTGYQVTVDDLVALLISRNMAEAFLSLMIPPNVDTCDRCNGKTKVLTTVGQYLQKLTQILDFTKDYR